MVHSWVKIPVKELTKQKIKKEIRIEFLLHHPEFKDMNLTYDFLINKMMDYYLNIK